MIILNELRVIVRSGKKQKLSSLLGIFSITIGMVACLFMMYYVDYEKDFDKNWNEANNIYRIALDRPRIDGTRIQSAQSFLGLCRVLENEIPEVASATGLLDDNVMAYTLNSYIKNAKLYWADTSFFKVFNIPLLYGNTARLFPTVQSAIISESAACRLFGRTNVMDQHFKTNEGWEFIVSGIFKDIPGNSHLKIDFLLKRETLFYYLGHFDNKTQSLKTDGNITTYDANPQDQWVWKEVNTYTYVKLKPQTDRKVFEAKLQALVNRYTRQVDPESPRTRVMLQPVSSIHLNSRLNHEMSVNADKNSIDALQVVSILILIISWIIFINLQIARISEKAKDTGVRKVFGATPLQLILNMILKTGLTNLFSVLLALGMFFMFKDAFDRFLEITPNYSIRLSFLVYSILLFILGGFLCGLYPAYSLVSRNSRELLIPNGFVFGQGFNTRKWLIIFQFSASIGLLICTAFIVKQINFVRNKELGVNTRQVYCSYTSMNIIKKEGAIEHLKQFLGRVEHVPGVLTACLSSVVPGKEVNIQSSEIGAGNDPQNKGSNFQIVTSDNKYFQVYNPQLMAGRFFSFSDKITSNQLIINEQALFELGWHTPSEALGKFVSVKVDDYIHIPKAMYQVIGIVRNFHQESLRKAVRPMVFLLGYNWHYDVGYISILTEKSFGQHNLEEIKNIWKEFYPNDPFEFRCANDNYEVQLRSDRHVAEIFAVFSVLSMTLAVVGLWGLAQYTARKKTKEIGIRKVNGASTFDILIILNGNFSKWVGLAFIIACPLAFLGSRHWLQNFAYKTELSWWVFILVGTGALLIALLTVSLQAYKVASRNPAEAIRYE